MADTKRSLGRPLIRCDFGLRAVPWGLFAAPIAAGVFGTLFLGASCAGALAEGRGRGLWVIVACGMAITLVRQAVAEARDAARAEANAL